MESNYKIRKIVELRRKTNMPLMDCKKALNKSDWDSTKAEEYLNSGAWRVGKLINER